MQTEHDHLRTRLLHEVEKSEKRDLVQIRRNSWNRDFEQLMRNRLVMGALRYGEHAPGLIEPHRWSHGERMYRLLELYEKEGNLEALVDLANYCMLEWVNCEHPKAHFSPVDDGILDGTHCHRR